MADYLVRPSGRSGRPGKYGHGLALTPSVEAFSSHLLRGSTQDAAYLLIRLHGSGWSIDRIENEVIAPAVFKICEMWNRGRISDSHFELVCPLCERVERYFRLSLVSKQCQ